MSFAVGLGAGERKHLFSLLDRGPEAGADVQGYWWRDSWRVRSARRPPGAGAGGGSALDQRAGSRCRTPGSPAPRGLEPGVGRLQGRPPARPVPRAPVAFSRGRPAGCIPRLPRARLHPARGALRPGIRPVHGKGRFDEPRRRSHGAACRRLSNHRGAGPGDRAAARPGERRRAGRQAARAPRADRDREHRGRAGQRSRGAAGHRPGRRLGARRRGRRALPRGRGARSAPLRGRARRPLRSGREPHAPAGGRARGLRRRHGPAPRGLQRRAGSRASAASFAEKGRAYDPPKRPLRPHDARRPHRRRARDARQAGRRPLRRAGHRYPRALRAPVRAHRPADAALHRPAPPVPAPHGRPLARRRRAQQPGPSLRRQRGRPRPRRVAAPGLARVGGLPPRRRGPAPRLRRADQRLAADRLSVAA